MSELAFICQWYSGFGYSRQEAKYIKYFKKKKMILYVYNNDEDDFQDFLEFIEDMEYIHNNIMNVTLRIVKKYDYKQRVFCNINRPFYTFIKKCKNYYKEKLNHYKNPKNVLHRQIFGCYSRFQY